MFEQFVKRFPDFRSLAIASLYDVLRVWQGLGYNRRGKYLHEIAKEVVVEYNGVFPTDPELLITFPGIGAATAASICAFAFNSPTVFIETNIRTVFIHFFFQAKERVHDREILSLVAQTLEKSRPREWYYALMDYGVMLKRTANVSNRKSAHYSKQSRFEGSDRQIRGSIIRVLTERKQCQLSDLVEKLEGAADRVKRIVFDLQKEGLVMLKHGCLFIE